MHNFTLSGLTLSVALALSLTATAQTRGINSGEALPRPVPAASTSLPKTNPSGQRVTSNVFCIGQRPGGLLFDADATSAPKAQKAPAKILGDGTTIYGSLVYSDYWDGTATYGIWSFPASQYVKPTQVVNFPYFANGGGCLVGDTYYYSDYVYDSSMGYTFTTFCWYNFNTQEFNKITRTFLDASFDQSQITHDMAYDPTTDQIFVISYLKKEVVEGALAKFVPAISTIDPMTAMVTPIGETPQMAAIAINQAGELYGVSMGVDSKLYRINKTSGECTEIGPTGLIPDYVQSATFDPITDKMYWTATLSNLKTGLYEVNIKTGEAMKITDFDHQEEFTGIYIPEPVIEVGAPAKAENLTYSFPNGALSGTVSVTAPSKAYNGAALSGNVDMVLSIDGEEVLTKSVAPGATMTHNATLTEGIHSFTINVSNSVGAGPRTGISGYIGIDGPNAPTDLTVQHNENGTATLSWTAPTSGRNDGYINPSQLKYTVRRCPEMEMIAENLSTTTFTDPLNVPAGMYYYEVTAYMDGREGLPAYTEAETLGNGTGLPCRFSFDSKEEFELFTNIDVNNKAEARYHWGAWTYSPEYSWTADEDPCAVYLRHPEYDADDWLITPPFTVESGKKYKVTYTMWTRGDKEKLEITAGTLNAPAQQQVITPVKEYNNTDKQQFTQEFTASASGNYYVGFHITSSKNAYYLFVDNIEIDEVADESAPVPVGNLTITPAELGAMSAEIAMDVPNKTVGGANLTSVSRIDIFRDNDKTAIYSFDKPAVGTRVSWTDTKPLHGWNTYRVVAYNAAGLAGEKAVAKAFVGIDTPTAVTDLKLTETNGHPTLTWGTPEGSDNGGYYNPDNLIYEIIRNDGVVVSRSAKGNTFVDESLDPAEKQYFIYYQVTPRSEVGGANYALSNSMVYGDPYQGDFLESFSDVATQNDPWVLYRVKGKNQLWKLYSQGYSPLCGPVDDDGGLAVFEATVGNRGDESRMVSPKIDLSSFDIPVLSFYFYKYPSVNLEMDEEPYEDRLTVELYTPDGQFIPVLEDIMVDDARYMEGWLKYSINLEEYKQLGWAQISFRGIADFASDVTIDRVEVTDNVSNDLAVYSFNGPAKVAAGKKATYKATIANYGINAAENYNVILLRDGVEVDRKAGPAVASKQYASVRFDVDALESEIGKTFKYTINIDFADDAIPGNNISDPVSTTVVAPQYPEVLHLNGTVENNNVTLSWEKADALRVNDSFEDYAAFSIDEIGDYTLIDGDAANTYGFADLYFENSGEPMAFIIFNPVTLGITPILQEYAAHTGNQVLASFAAVDYNTGNSVQNNDWFITPEIYPGTTFSFWAKTANYEWGYESFEVMYSTTNTSTTAFKKLDAVTETPKDWTQYTYTVPENAKYMAIHYNSDDKFLFYVDDLSFIGKYTGNAYTLTGYRVYRDGVAIADLPATQMTFTDAIGETDYHTYTVRALYGSRESADSDKYIACGSGVDSNIADGISVTTRGHEINVNCPADMNVRIINTAGTTLYERKGGDHRFLTAGAGAYIVTVGSHRYKVMVK